MVRGETARDGGSAVSIHHFTFVFLKLRVTVYFSRVEVCKPFPYPVLVATEPMDQTH